MSKDYIFHVNWDDRHKNSYRIGMLAQIDDLYYFIIRSQEKAEIAYSKGFMGIPGFRPEEVYKSREMFDFFKSRILVKANTDVCEELAKTRGISMIDSFSLDEVTERMTDKYKELILRAYDIQQKKAQLKEENEVEDSKKEEKTKGTSNNSSALEDIE